MLRMRERCAQNDVRCLSGVLVFGNIGLMLLWSFVVRIGGQIYFRVLSFIGLSGMCLLQPCDNKAKL